MLVISLRMVPVTPRTRHSRHTDNHLKHQKIAKLGSRFCEQQQGPLKGPYALLLAHWATVVHRGWPADRISYPRHGGYTTAPYVFCTDHVRISLGATSHALELCLSGPATGVNVSASWTSLARVLGPGTLTNCRPYQRDLY